MMRQIRASLPASGTAGVPARVAVSVAALALLALTGCQAGQTAQTSRDYNPADGRNINIPQDAAFNDPYLAVRNALVVSLGKSASLTLTVVNHGPEGDVLQQATVGDRPVRFEGGPVEIAPGHRVRMGLGSDIQTLIADAGVAPGEWTTLTLSFANAGITELDVLVVPLSDEYATASG